MAIIGLIALIISRNPLVAITPVIGAIAWFISIRAFMSASAEDAASVAWSGLWPKEEEH
jgi:tetrahydromethanopterin S-methyltransferase subunit C